MTHRALLAAAFLFTAAGCASQGSSTATAERHVSTGDGGDITVPAEGSDGAYALTGSNAAHDEYWAHHGLSRQTVGDAEIDVPADR
jgi:hypothetical protein